MRAHPVLTLSALSALSVLGACSGGDESGESESCLSVLWDEVSDEPAVIRQFADYEALRAEGIDVDSFGEDFGPELQGVVLPWVVTREINFQEPVSIRIDSMACYVGDPIGGPEFLRLTTIDPLSSLPESASQEDDLVIFQGDQPSTANPVEVDVFGALLARGAIAGESLAVAPNGWVTGIGIAPAESGFALVVIWAPAESSPADAAALMNDTIEDSKHPDALDFSAADVAQDSGLLVATIPVMDRQLGIWKELTAILDPLVFPTPSD